MHELSEEARAVVDARQAGHFDPSTPEKTLREIWVWIHDQLLFRALTPELEEQIRNLRAAGYRPLAVASALELDRKLAKKYIRRIEG